MIFVGIIIIWWHSVVTPLFIYCSSPHIPHCYSIVFPIRYYYCWLDQPHPLSPHCLVLLFGNRGRYWWGILIWWWWRVCVTMLGDGGGIRYVKSHSPFTLHACIICCALFCCYLHCYIRSTGGWLFGEQPILERCCWHFTFAVGWWWWPLPPVLLIGRWVFRCVYAGAIILHFPSLLLLLVHFATTPTFIVDIPIARCYHSGAGCHPPIFWPPTPLFVVLLLSVCPSFLLHALRYTSFYIYIWSRPSFVVDPFSLAIYTLLHCHICYLSCCYLFIDTHFVTSFTTFICYVSLFTWHYLFDTFIYSLEFIAPHYIYPIYICHSIVPQSFLIFVYCYIYEQVWWWYLFVVGWVDIRCSVVVVVVVVIYCICCCWGIVHCWHYTLLRCYISYFTIVFIILHLTPIICYCCWFDGYSHHSFLSDVVHLLLFLLINSVLLVMIDIHSPHDPTFPICYIVYIPLICCCPIVIVIPILFTPSFDLFPLPHCWSFRLYLIEECPHIICTLNDSFWFVVLSIRSIFFDSHLHSYPVLYLVFPFCDPTAPYHSIHACDLFLPFPIYSFTFVGSPTLFEFIFPFITFIV